LIPRISGEPFQNENIPKILDVLSQIKEIAARHNTTPGQATLAWILAQGSDFVVIPGTKKVKYLEANAGAVAVKLTSEITTITMMVKNADLPGERYPCDGGSLHRIEEE